MLKALSVYSGDNYPPIDMDGKDFIFIPKAKNNAVFMIDNGDDTASIITITKINVTPEQEYAGRIRDLDVPPNGGHIPQMEQGEILFSIGENILENGKELPKVHFHGDGADIYINLQMSLKGIKKEHPAFR